MPNEAWMPIPGYEGIYEVSDLGRVRSVDRLDSAGQRRRGRLMTQSLVHGGYPRVTLTKNGVDTARKVHQLVLNAFIGPCPLDMEACHDNGQPADNRITNLRWDTRLSNAADKIRHGTTCHGERHHSSKLTEDDIPVIFKMRMAGVTVQLIASKFGVSSANVSQILLRRKWKHVPIERDAELEEDAKRYAV